MMATAIIALFATEVVVSAQGVLIGPGGHFDFEVTSLTYVGPSDPQDIGALLLNFHNDLLDPGETISLIVSRTPITDTTAPGISFTQLPSQPSSSGFAWMQSDPFWPNLPGFLRVQMQNGSIELSSISIEQMVNGGIYSGTFEVPEPSTGALATLGLVLFGMFASLKRPLAKNELGHKPAVTSHIAHSCPC